MNADYIVRNAQIIKEAQDVIRAKKLASNRVKQIEEKQIEKVNAPIVAKLEENKEQLKNLVEETKKNDLEMGFKNEFSELSDGQASVRYRFNNRGNLDEKWKYVSSNREKLVIKIQSLSDISNIINIELPNSKVFYMFFVVPSRIIGLTDSDISSYIDIVNSKLGINLSGNKTLIDARKEKASKATPTKLRSRRKEPLLPTEAKEEPPIAPPIEGKGILDSIREGNRSVNMPTYGSGVVRGKSGNLLYNNKTLMKKLLLMLQESDAGNNGLKKDIAMFLDEAKKRGLIEAWMHKKTMKDYVLKPAKAGRT